MQGRGLALKKAKTSKNAVFADGAGGGSLTLKIWRFSGNPSHPRVRLPLLCVFDLNKKLHFTRRFFLGAGGGSRTHMKLPSTDFESVASAIPPHQHIKL